MSEDQLEVEQEAQTNNLAKPGIFKLLAFFNGLAGLMSLSILVVGFSRDNIASIAAVGGFSTVAFTLSILLTATLQITSAIGMWRLTTWGWWAAAAYFINSATRYFSILILGGVGSIQLERTSDYWIRYGGRFLFALAILAFLMIQGNRDLFGIVDRPKQYFLVRWGLIFVGLFALGFSFRFL